MNQLQIQLHNQSLSLSDGVLVGQFLAGNSSAFEELVHQYDAQLLGYIRSYLSRYGDDEQANDVLQHVLLQLYLSLPTLMTNKPLKPWLFRVAHNRCIDEIRSKRRRRVVQFSELESETDEEGPLTILQDEHPLPEEVIEEQDRRREIQSAILTLPSRFHTVVQLRLFSDLSFSEIAQILEMPVSAVKTSFHRALPRLRIALKKL